MSDNSPNWMICWNTEGGMDVGHAADLIDVADAISKTHGKELFPGYRARLLIWLRAAQLGDVLEFPLGIVVRTSNYATEIDYEEPDYDRERQRAYQETDR